MPGDHDSPAFRASLLEDLQDEVYVYDSRTLKLRYMNRAARTRMGWSPAEVKQKSISETAATFSTEAFRAHTAPLLAKKTNVVTIGVTHPKGPVEISTQLIDGVGDEKLFLSVLRDLSWRKQSENEHLKTVSTISHELRTPLTSIHGALKLLNGGAAGKIEDETKSIIDIASRNTERLLAIVNDILDFEQLKSNKMDFSISEDDLVECLEDCVELLSGYASEHRVNLRFHSSVRVAVVKGNSARISQVVTNLISNAVKYSPKGEEVLVSLERDGGDLRVAVTDHGPGISEENKKLLFKPFSQVQAGDGSRRPGTGLGLAIVHSILQRLEFPIEVESTVGKGSTFAFRVPEHLVMGTVPSSHLNRSSA